MYRRVATVPVLIGACVAAAVALPAASADWRLTGTFSQGFSASQPFDSDSRGSVSSSTSLGVTAALRTPTTSLSLSPSLGVSASSRATGSDRVRFTPRLRGSLGYRAPRVSGSASLSLVPQFLSARTFDQVLEFDPETGLLDLVPVARDVDPLQVTISASAGLGFSLGPRDSLNTSVSASVVEYTEGAAGLAATRNYGGSVGWSRRFTQRTSGNLAGGVRRFETVRSAAPGRTSYSLTPGFSHALTPRHSVSGGLGVTYVDGERSRVTVNFNGGLAYRAGDTGVTLGFGQSLQQGDDGALDNVTRLSLTASRRFTPFWSGSFATSVNNSAPLGGGGRDRQTFTLGPSVSYALSRNWSVRGSYGLIVERVSGDLSASNRVSLQLSRAFAF